MVEGVMHFSVKSIGLSGYGDRKKCTLMEAARHNLREIQAEHGAKGHIDPTRIHQNVTMAGPTVAAQVVALSAKLAADAGVDLTKLRKDHCQAIELVFSLPRHTSVNAPSYFADCLKWARTAYGLPVLLATVHYDEATNHMHVLLLPVKDGEHVGSKPLARGLTKKNRDSFFKAVAGPAGLGRDNAKLRGITKQWAVAAVLRECERRNLPQANGALWPVLRGAIELDPTVALALLNIDVNSIRPEDSAQQALPSPSPEKPIGFEEVASKPIGFSPGCMELQNLSCVGFSPKRASPDRLHVAREAERIGIERLAKRKAASVTTAAELTDVEGLLRVRDSDFDAAAWAD